MAGWTRPMAPHALVPHTTCSCPFFSLGMSLNFQQEGKINVCQATHLPVGLLQPVPMPSSGILVGRVTAGPDPAQHPSAPTANTINPAINPGNTRE